MKIGKREDFALILMSELAKYYPKGYISLTKIAKDEKLSVLFLKHIASEMLKRGLIKSKEGISGGYKLNRNPKDIAVSEIVGAISDGVVTPACMHGSKCRVKKSSCSCKVLWDKVNKHLLAYLSKISLAEFAKI